MPVEFASAPVGEPAPKPDFVTIDEAGPLPRGMHERELIPCPLNADLACIRRDDERAEFAANSPGRALRTVGTYVLLRALMGTMERTSAGAQILELKKKSWDPRLRDAERICNAYHLADKVIDQQVGPQHQIDIIA